METKSNINTCRYCNRIMPTVIDTVRLHPCGCNVCKDCWMDRLAETRLISTFVACRACGRSVASHHYVKHALNGTVVVPEAVNFDYSRQQAPPPPPPLRVPGVAGTARTTTTAGTAGAATATAAATSGKASTTAAKSTNSTTPTKRKRGRPPKHSKTLPVSEKGAASDAETTAATVTATAASTSPPPAKKKNGRPPKNSEPPTTDTTTTTANNNNDTESTNTTSPSTNVASKRRPRKSFDERLQDLLDYKKKYGDTRVPYRSAGHESLGEWVKDIRRGHLKTTREQRQQLNKAGFYWETKRNMQERLWHEMLEKLKTYKEQYGDCRVRHAEDKVLYEWINTQRKSKNKNALRQDRLEALDAVGMIWSMPLSSTATTTTKTTGLSRDEHHGGGDGGDTNDNPPNDNHHNNTNYYHHHQSHVYEPHGYL